MYCCGNCDFCNVEKIVRINTEQPFSTFSRTSKESVGNEPLEEVTNEMSETSLVTTNSTELATNNPEYEIKKNLFGKLVAKRIK